MADNFNWLSDYVPRPTKTDPIDRLGRSFALGRSLGMVPYQNEVVAKQMADLEQAKQVRNAMSQYGQTGDIQPLKEVDLMKSIEVQDKQAAMELKKAGVTDKQMETGIDAITKLAPLINEQNYEQFKPMINSKFGYDVMPDKFNPDVINKVVAFAGRAKGGFTNVAPGGAVLDPTGRLIFQNPLQAKPISPYEAGRLAIDRADLDRKTKEGFTTIPSTIDPYTDLPGGPDRIYQGKVQFPPQPRGQSGKLFDLENAFRRINPGKPVTQEALAEFNGLFNSEMAKARNPADAAAGIMAKTYEAPYIDEKDPAKRDELLRQDRAKVLKETTALIADLQKQYGRKTPAAQPNATPTTQYIQVNPLQNIKEGEIKLINGKRYTRRGGVVGVLE